MSERKMEGDGFEEIIDSIANDVARLGSKSSIADLLMSLDKWTISHNLKLDFSDERDLEQLKKEFQDPEVFSAFVKAFNKHLQVKIGTIEIDSVPTPLSDNVVAEIEECVIHAENNLNSR